MPKTTNELTWKCSNLFSFSVNKNIYINNGEKLYGQFFDLYNAKINNKDFQVKTNFLPSNTIINPKNNITYCTLLSTNNRNTLIEIGPNKFLYNETFKEIWTSDLKTRLAILVFDFTFWKQSGKILLYSEDNTETLIFCLFYLYNTCRD